MTDQRISALTWTAIVLILAVIWYGVAWLFGCVPPRVEWVS